MLLKTTCFVHCFESSMWLCGCLFEQTRRKPSRETDGSSDGDSSVCEELIEEPVKEESISKELTANKDRFVRIITVAIIVISTTIIIINSNSSRNYKNNKYYSFWLYTK